MKRLWSPWRMKYIQNNPTANQCPFCAALEDARPADHYLVDKGKKTFVILNRYPYTTGHLLILPLEHQEQMDALDPEDQD